MIRTSCTKDDAVMYLLRRKKFSQKYNFELEDFHPEESDIYEPTLDEELFNSAESANADYYNAVDEKLSDEVISAKLAKFKATESDKTKAEHYLCDIDDELAKLDKSELRIDRSATKNSDYPFITLSSLNLWAHKKYGISIFEDPESKILDENSQQQQESILDEKTDTKGGLSKTKAENLYTTFAFLLEAFAKTAAPKFRGDDNTPNVSAIAKRLNELATEANRKMHLSGQSYEAIKSCIEEAMDIKKSKTPK